MEAVRRFLSRQTVLLFGIINLLLINGAFSNNVTMFPPDFAMQSCELSNGKEGICVYGYLCRDSIINIDGNGIIDLRYLDVCEDYFLQCCSKETPCLENTGTCVSARNCAANLNDPKKNKFKQTDECNWSGYTCCPNDNIGENKATNQTDMDSCDFDHLCVPHDECKVNPDGDGLLEARSSVCSSDGHTCCPKSMIKTPGRDKIAVPGSSDGQTNSIEQYETCDDQTVCVPDDQCLVKPDGGDFLQARASICSGMNQTCCPRDKVRGNDPCSEVGGTCIKESSCPASSALQFDIRTSQCVDPGFVCCMNSTNAPNENINKTCSNGKGKCTPKNQCRGTTYRDRNNDCGGLACCAVLSTTTPHPSVSSSTPSKSEDNEKDGKACFSEKGICTSGNCVGIKYKDRKNECGGLNCCAITSEGTSTTILPDVVIDGKECYNKKGVCKIAGCLGQTYRDINNDCEGLNCCADVPEPITEPSNGDTVRSCNSIGGKCTLDSNCYHKTELAVDGCEHNEVCCVPDSGPDEEIKNCGYRNEIGVKFNTIGRVDGESQFGEFPWMVAIMVKEKGNFKFICGGSLIDPEVVLTSAECVKTFKRTPDRLIVRAGEWDMGTTREPISHEERQVTKIKSHPEFRATSLINNIALLFLNDKFGQSSTINTVCLPPQDFEIDNGEVTASGWGATPQNRTKHQQILKSIDLPYNERSDCEQQLRKSTKNRNFKLHRSFICAGGVYGVDTCKGDAGSPIVYTIPNDFESRYYAVGMVSWGVGCGKANVPAVYTDIAFFRTWIDKEMEMEGLQAHYYTYTV